LKDLLAGTVPCDGFCRVGGVGVLTLNLTRVLIERSNLFFEDIAMNLRMTTVALVFAAAPLIAQTSGVSRPDPTVITSDDAVPTPKPLTPRPSAAVPATAPTGEVYGPYIPYQGQGVASAPPVVKTAPVENPLDAMIVVSVPEREGELREGTLLKTNDQCAFDGVYSNGKQIHGGGDGGDREEWPGDYSSGIDS